MPSMQVVTILLIVVSFGVLIGVSLFVLDRYLDLRVISYTADAQRQATNLLNLVLNSEITKEKLVVDVGKFRKYYESDWFSIPMSADRKVWEKNYELVEYDYNFSLREFGGEIHQVGNLIFNMDDECYFDYQRIKGYVEMPISVYDENYDEYMPGIANLTLMRTPLSELSFLISQSSLRIEEGYESEIVKSIRVGPDVKSILFEKEILLANENDNNDVLCMNVNDKWACKHYYPGSSSVRICTSNKLIPEDYIPGSCKGLLAGGEKYDLLNGCKAIYINATNGVVNIIIPGSASPMII